MGPFNLPYNSSLTSCLWRSSRCAGFKSKKIRVNLNLPIKAETKTESTDVLKTVDEDRKYVIQATIVRYANRFTPSFCPLMGFQNYEGPKNNEEPALDSRSHFADLTKIRTEDSRYQEGLSTAGHLGSSMLTVFAFLRLSTPSSRRSTLNEWMEQEIRLHTWHRTFHSFFCAPCSISFATSVVCNIVVSISHSFFLGR